MILIAGGKIVWMVRRLMARIIVRILIAWRFDFEFSLFEESCGSMCT